MLKCVFEQVDLAKQGSLIVAVLAVIDAISGGTQYKKKVVTRAQQALLLKDAMDSKTKPNITHIGNSMHIAMFGAAASDYW
jgi:hypothetical protein